MWHRADETPLTAVFVDTPDRIEAILRLVDEIIPDSVAVTQVVHSVQYVRAHTH